MNTVRGLGVFVALAALVLSVALVIERWSDLARLGAALQPSASRPPVGDATPAPANVGAATATPEGLQTLLSGLFATPTPRARTHIEVVSPPDRSTVWLGRPVEVRVAVVAPVSIVRMELLVNGAPDSIVVPERTVTELTHSFEWTPETTGEAAVEVVVYSSNDQHVKTTPAVFHVADNTGVMAAIAGWLDPPAVQEEWLRVPSVLTRAVVGLPPTPIVPTHTPSPHVSLPAPTTGAGCWNTPTPDVGVPDVSSGF